MNTDYYAIAGAPFRVDLQMVMDSSQARGWGGHAHRLGETGGFTGWMIYNGQRGLSEDVLYLIPEGMEQDFPADQFSYITTLDLQGQAPHIRSAGASFLSLINDVMAIFARAAGFERDLSNIISTGGSLSDLCSAAAGYFGNPVFVHDNLFCVIGRSGGMDGIFEFSEHSKMPHIPLWLIEELRFDEGYKSTLMERKAGILGPDLNYTNVRGLYVNLWQGDAYLGRLLINESESTIRPGQLWAAEFLAGYVLRWLRNQSQSNQQVYHSYDKTFVELMTRGETDERELKTILEIMKWKREDRYLFLKFQSQDPDDNVHSDLAINSRLATVLKDYVSFLYQEKLCVILNLSVSNIDVRELRPRLAPLIRENCLHVGISNPVEGILEIRRGNIQADIALGYITGVDSSDWMVLFPTCALNYICESACGRLPAKMVAHPVLLDLMEHDRALGTQYYETLRTYLLCERSIPATAAALIIHRTTLTYRLGKIMELTRLNLDNENLRMYLLISFLLLDRGGLQVPEQDPA